MTDGFRKAFVRRLWERKPTPRVDLPVVHTTESEGPESMQHLRDEAEQALDLHDLPLPEDRLEPT